jgi:site-specific recombinase
MSPNLLTDLRNFRQILRDLKADNLREYRRYKREGYGAGMPDFMYGMALGKTAALSHIELMINVLEVSDDTQNV